MQARTSLGLSFLRSTARATSAPQPILSGLRYCSTSCSSRSYETATASTSSLAASPALRASSTASLTSKPPQQQVRRQTTISLDSGVEDTDKPATMPDRAWTNARVPPTPKELLETNQKWIADADPEMFAHNAKGQKPSIFWLGCCDSRVPAELITGAAPGDLFVHRNIANTFSPKDGSALAALAYAVNNLEVSHVIVCGHLNCGGVQAALASAKERQAVADTVDEGTEAIQAWLTPIRALAVANLRTSSSFAAETDHNKAMRALVEQNVCAQVSNVASCSVIKNAWRRGRKLTVHGWVYDIGSGRLEDLGVSEGTSTETFDAVSAA